MEGVFTKEVHKSLRAVEGGKAIAVVGIYGSGKVLVADELVAAWNGPVVRVSFKELPKPTHTDVYRVFGFASCHSDFEFHYALKEYIQTQKGKRVLFCIEEAQALLTLPESFFDALESLRYRNEPNVSIILFGQPELIHSTNSGFTRLVKDAYDYLQPLSKLQIQMVIRRESHRLGISFEKWQHAIISLSGGHYGTIKYVCQLIKKHRYNGTKLTAKTVMTWAEHEANFVFFLRIVWESLDDAMRLLLTELLKTGSIAPDRNKSVAFDYCIKLGLIRMHGSSCSFIVPMYRDVLLSQFCRPNASKVSDPIEVSGNTLMVFGNSVDGLLTHQEKRVVSTLVTSKGNTVPYDEIGSILWGSHTHRFSLENIAQIVSRIRKKLSAIGIAPNTIRTVSKQGYMFTG